MPPAGGTPANLNRGNAVVKVDDELIKRLVVDEKKHLAEVAELAGCKVRTVQRSLRRSKVPPLVPAQNPYTEEEKAWAEAMLKEGTPYSEVARTLGRDASRLAEKFPGYANSRSEIAQIRHMMMRFERLLEALGLADVGMAR